MKIGMNTRVSSRSLDVAVVAQKAEALGFESLWLPEHGVMPVHVYLHVGAGVPVPLHICTDDIHGVPSHYIKDTLAQDYLEGKGRRIRAVSSDYATGSSCTTSTV